MDSLANWASYLLVYTGSWFWKVGWMLNFSSKSLFYGFSVWCFWPGWNLKIWIFLWSQLLLWTLLLLHWKISENFKLFKTLILCVFYERKPNCPKQSFRQALAVILGDYGICCSAPGSIFLLPKSKASCFAAVWWCRHEPMTCSLLRQQQYVWQESCYLCTKLDVRDVRNDWLSTTELLSLWACDNT